MKIKNIILDFGGVLLDIDYQLTEKAFIDLGCRNFRALYSQAAQANLFDDFETGKISEDVFFEELKRLANIPHLTEKDLKNAWNAMLIGFRTEVYVMLQELKQKYRLFLLSNTNETHINAFEKLLEKVCPVNEFENLFEKVYYSCRINQRKPNAECFQFVLNNANIKPEETIFIDDSIQHVEGANKASITAFWLQEKPLNRAFIKAIVKQLA
jgi:putative hydrolase of the HAD superfamily